MDLRIARDGTWFHEGVPFQREALVRLFASILRRDEDGHYYLVTPVKNGASGWTTRRFWRCDSMQAVRGSIRRSLSPTNVGDVVVAGPDHPLIVEYRTPGGEPSPYLHVRGRLRALLTRAVFVELVELGEERPDDRGRGYGVWSQGQFFSLGRLDDET